MANRKPRKPPFRPVRSLVGSFILMILIGTILLALPAASEDGKPLPILDSLFTSTSAVCVTGLIVRDTPTQFTTFGEIVILLLMQAGGIGIITFTTLFAALMGKRIRYRNLNLLKDTLGSHPERSMTDILRWVVVFVLTIELIGTILLIPSFSRVAGGARPVYLAIFHSVSAFCNAGFSLFSDSLMGFKGDWLLNIVICALIITGGIGFPVLIDIYQTRRLSRLTHHSKLVLKVTLWLIIVGWGLIYFFESRISPEFWHMPAHQRILTALFQSITARTAGFNTLNIGSMSTASLIILICLMYIGGSPAGTAGGIKTTTFAVTLRNAFAFLSGKNFLELEGRRISQISNFRAVSVAFIGAAVLVIATILLTSLSKVSMRDAMFEATSALGTVGLSTGITSSLDQWQKAIIILLMFVGRLGPVSLALSLRIKDRGEVVARPEIEILTG